jgi:hypothetical protein
MMVVNPDSQVSLNKLQQFVDRMVAQMISVFSELY